MPSVAGVNLTAAQVGNANIIAEVGRQRGVSSRDIAIAIATAMQESSLQSLSGGDRDSVGLFQQRPSMGWGSAGDLMNPRYAAGKFYDALSKVAGRESMSLTAAAQKVQRSGHPTAYARWEGLANALAGNAGNGDPGSAPLPRPSLLDGRGNIDSNAAVSEYGFVAALANSVPDIKRVLNDAIRGGWSPERFQSALESTAWWRNTASSQRADAMLRSSDPAEHKRQRDIEVGDAWSMLQNLGIPGSDDLVGKMVDRKMRLGWSDAEMRRYLAAEVHVDGRATTGLTAATVMQLKDEASQYLVQMPTPVLEKWTRDILAGNVPADAFHSYLVGQAKAQFPTMAGALDSGITVSQYLDPYKKLAAQTLEVAPESVDWNDGAYRDPLIQQDPQGQRSILSLSEYEKKLKAMPQYRTTHQAQSSAADMTNSLLQQFGKVAR